MCLNAYTCKGLFILRDIHWNQTSFEVFSHFARIWQRCDEFLWFFRRYQIKQNSTQNSLLLSTHFDYFGMYAMTSQPTKPAVFCKHIISRKSQTILRGLNEYVIVRNLHQRIRFKENSDQWYTICLCLETKRTFVSRFQGHFYWFCLVIIRSRNVLGG